MDQGSSAEASTGTRWARPADWTEGDFNGDERVTGYRCRTGNVRRARLVARAVLCVQRYKKLPGLYDVVFRLATLGQPRSGVLSTLTLSGVSFANAQLVIRRYAGAIAWSE